MKRKRLKAHRLNEHALGQRKLTKSYPAKKIGEDKRRPEWNTADENKPVLCLLGQWFPDFYFMLMLCL